MKIVQRIVGVLALSVFIVSLIIHVLTYQSVNLGEQYQASWLMYGVVFAVFAFAILTAQKSLDKKTRGLRPLIKQMPVWAWIIILIFFVYTVFNMIATLDGLAVPTEVGGKYVLNNHGNIREYTPEQVEAIKIHQIRGSSGFWLWLSLSSSLYLLTAKQNQSEIEAGLAP